MNSFLLARILLTTAYTEQFDFPLTASEIYQRLLVNRFITREDFIESLVFLVKARKIIYFEGYFFIVGVDEAKKKKLSSFRRIKREYADNKWLEVKEFVAFAKKIPFISGVAVTGSLAVNNTIKDDDVDFMLVTFPNRLWITRIIVILYASLKRKRRSFAKEEKNSWCFNLWVEATDLQLPQSSRSVYEAYEVIQAVWVLSRKQTARVFRNLNNWTKQVIFMNNFSARTVEHDILTLNMPIFSKLIDLVNLFAYLAQYSYMKPHMTREKVSKTHAFFHPRDTKSAVFENWQKTLMRLKGGY
jgi:hypothetical protein